MTGKQGTIKNFPTAATFAVKLQPAEVAAERERLLRLEGEPRLGCTMRVAIIGRFKPCMTEIHLHIWCAHGRFYPHAPVSMNAWLGPQLS